MCYIAGSARGQYEANPESELTTRANWQSLQLLETAGGGVAKIVRGQRKQRKHKRLSWVYCATNTVGLLSRLSKSKSHSWFGCNGHVCILRKKNYENFIEPFPKQNRTKLCKLVNNRCNDKKVLLIGLFVVSCRYEEMV